jgi:DNA topoisomerase I
MRLLIVESPNKIKKLRSLLPKDIRVSASVGHIRDLPTTGGGLGVRFSEQAIEPDYVITKQDVVRKLQQEAKNAECIMLAMDPDREGEAIAWHIAESLGKNHQYQRVAFQAITKKAVNDALSQPRSIDMNLVNAQQARRVLDRVVGWVVSPVLKRNLGKDARSAGRVQSVALRLVAEREEDIRAFDKKDYFVLVAHFGTQEPQRFSAKLSHWQGKELGHRLPSAADAEALKQQLEPGPWGVVDVQKKRLTKNPPPPFTTSTAQQAASVRLKMTPKASMAALQRLFEAGHITYHRTDSVALAPEAIDAARSYISQNFSPEFLPKNPRIFATKSANAQEAHEAIRPTHPENGANAVSGEDGKLYRLIWERFIACQMAAALDDTTSYQVVSASDTSAIFTAKGVVVAFDGWRALTKGDATEEKKKTSKDDDEPQGALPAQAAGDVLDLRHLDADKRSTKPPPRYTQASLIKKLEQEGVGRPSTYASIMNTILIRGYVEEIKRKLHATDLGLQVNDWLRNRFRGDFIELSYTAAMEAALDAICTGQKAWEDVVRKASEAVQSKAQTAGLGYDVLAGEARFDSQTAENVTCPQCGGAMKTRQSRYGVFYGCAAYPKCKGTRPGPEDKQKTPQTENAPSQAPPAASTPPAEAPDRKSVV